VDPACTSRSRAPSWPPSLRLDDHQFRSMRPGEPDHCAEALLSPPPHNRGGDSTPRPLPERPHTPNKRDTGPDRKPPFRVSQARAPRAGERMSFCPLEGAAASRDAPDEIVWARTRVVLSMACCQWAEWPGQPDGCRLKKDERTWMVEGDAF